MYRLIHSLEQYEPLIGSAAVRRISNKADAVRDLLIVHVSSTFYGGGVTEILTPLTLMMNALGIETGWRMVQGTPAFFTCTRSSTTPFRARLSNSPKWRRQSRLRWSLSPVVFRVDEVIRRGRA